jgi:hypothetical protein
MLVLQIHKMVCSGSVASKHELGIQNKMYGLQDSDKSAVYHVIHDFTIATCQTGRPITSCKGVILTRFQNRDNHCFLPGSWDQGDSTRIRQESHSRAKG